MELFHLEQLMAIARCGSMSKAAERLFITQSALSQNMKKLERELGCTLLDRTRSPLRLTPYGEILLSGSERVALDLKEMLDQIEELKRTDALTVRVGCVQMALALVIMPKLARECPEMYYTASMCRSEAEALDGLLGGRFDVVLLPEGSKPAGFGKVVLGEERAFLSVPRGSALAKRESLAMSDCSGVTVTIPESMPGLSGWYRDMVAAGGPSPAKVAELPDDEYLASLDVSDVIHFRTSLMMSSVAADRDRVNVPIEDACSRRTVTALYPNHDAERLRGVLGLLDSCLSTSHGGLAPLSYLIYSEQLTRLNFEF